LPQICFSFSESTLAALLEPFGAQQSIDFHLWLAVSLFSAILYWYGKNVFAVMRGKALPTGESAIRLRVSEEAATAESLFESRVQPRRRRVLLLVGSFCFFTFATCGLPTTAEPKVGKSAFPFHRRFFLDEKASGLL